MEWMTAIRECIDYMENNILTVSGPAEIAAHVNMSQMYLQRGFQVVTGITLGEYVRNRRLYMAAMELASTDKKVIDIALKYGYETPESFTKAFGRFHDASPSQIRKHEKTPNTFLPMRIALEVKGGNDMDVSFETLDGFSLIGIVKDMPFDMHLKEVPKIWDEFMHKYGDVIKASSSSPAFNEFEKALFDNRVGRFDAFTTVGVEEGWCRFMIAGEYKGGVVPEGMEVWTVPASDWAKFLCEGPLWIATDNLKKHIWLEWLPGNYKYEFDGDYTVSKYSPNLDFAAIDFQSEMWIPVKAK